jgi:signal transduction histidine kinase
VTASRSRLLAATAFAIAGIAALLSPSPELATALIAALAGATLWTLAPPREGEALYADVLARIASPRRRVAARAAVVATAPLFGAGVAVYAALALEVTMTAPPGAQRPVDWRTSTGTGFLGLAFVTAADAAGLTLGGAGPLWCVLLVGAGLALFWGAGAAAGDDPFDDARLRTQLGFVLTAAGAAVILNRTGAFGLDTATLVGACAVLAVIAFVFVPRWLRTRRQLAAERHRRERAQERAEIGEMLHDSVLQTLALIQRREDTPGPVAALARRQERELRDWLLRGETPARATGRLEPALREAVAEIEDDHEVTIEAVIVGDAALTPALDALVAATREALLNAAVHGGGAAIALFAKVREGKATVFVRDRGPGFALEGMDPSRRGVRDSIIGRVERAGGYADVYSSPGEGCEVVLEVRV